MKVIIAGYGIEGKVSYGYYNARGDTVVIADERTEIEAPAGAKTILGPGAFSKLGDFDLIVRSPSINPNNLPYPGKVWSATNEFFAKCPAPIIGVTGTKGKGTTSSMVASILKADNKTVHLVGNIGVSALDELPEIEANHIVVFELSSFQLWDLEKSPQTTVVLKVEADHLDVHKDMTDYVSAKSNIRVHQMDTDSCFYHPTNSVSRQIATLRPGAQRYGIRDDGAVYAQDGNFCKGDSVICPTNAVRLPGEHNIENACAAISAALLYTESYQAVEKGLRSFEGLPHRIKLVRVLGGVSYYDDSYSSAPSAALAALRSFEQPKIMILGGYDKGADFTELATEIASTDTIRKLLLIGATASNIEQSLLSQGAKADLIERVTTTDFASIVHHARDVSRSGDVVVLSPACASFDMFKNFTDRGEQFVEIVNKL